MVGYRVNFTFYLYVKYPQPISPWNKEYSYLFVDGQRSNWELSAIVGMNWIIEQIVFIKWKYRAHWSGLDVGGEKGDGGEEDKWS